MTPYGTEAGFTEYAAAMGYTVPDGAVLPAIVRGSVYVDGVYGERFTGVQADMMQERAWPRIGATIYGSALASDAIPNRVVHAAYEAALIELRTPGFFSTTYTPGTQKVLTEVKGIKWQVVGNASKAGAMVPVSTAVEGLLDPLLGPADMPAILVV